MNNQEKTTNPKFLESLKKNIASKLNDGGVKPTNTTKVGEGLDMEEFTVGAFHYARLRVNKTGGLKPKFESVNPTILWEGKKQEGDIDDETKAAIRDALKDLDVLPKDNPGKDHAEKVLEEPSIKSVMDQLKASLQPYPNVVIRVSHEGTEVRAK